MRSRGPALQARFGILQALPFFPIKTLALAFGVTPARISAMRARLGMTEPRGDDVSARDADIEHLFRSGTTMDGIASKYGITRERVRQILVARGVPTEASTTFRMIDRVRTKEMQRRGLWDARAQHIYGCSFELARDLNSGKNFSAHGSKARMYVEQRRNSLGRGIDWKISFPDWCRIWDESGQWASRGRSGYVMGRIGDSGPYEVGNVEIITSSQNASDSYIVTPEIARRAKRAPVDPAYMSPLVARVAALVQEGKTHIEIAVMLGINKRSSWQYVDRAKRKLAILEERKAA